MVAYESLLYERKSDLCIVVGDVTFKMAFTIVVKKINIKVAHIEAGIRSGDISMAEDVIRIVTVSLSDYFFTTTVNVGNNLLNEDKVQRSIFFWEYNDIYTLWKCRKV
jgi:UDP-N-acetylglucosamine 2-epimerase (non-hydrolysing)